jgi:hypothetical protein
MAQTTDYEIANSSGLVFRGRVNEVFAAVQSNNSGSTAPTDTVGGMLWLDTSVSPAVLRRRNSADSAWLVTFSEEDYASQAEAQAGSNNAKLMTPLRVTENVTSRFNVTGSAPLYAPRAWVNFNGTGTVAIRASGNVSSITDNGTGDYTINFTTAMPDADYCAVFGTQTNTNTRGGLQLGENQTNVIKSTTQLRVLAIALSSATLDAAPNDSTITNVAIFR